jgi:hypothetical protein
MGTAVVFFGVQLLVRKVWDVELLPDDCAFLLSWPPGGHPSFRSLRPSNDRLHRSRWGGVCHGVISDRQWGDQIKRSKNDLGERRDKESWKYILQEGRQDGRGEKLLVVARSVERVLGSVTHCTLHRLVPSR